ncbi:MAG: type II toxin-antitoxin system VapC family toxin [Xanthomonadaceae bacterium]|nr:type II toxin-antitoxin system VapC family toxin [Xanthomonadaceae bacterium]
MIAYLDTSALARLYLPEAGRQAVVDMVGREDVTPCSHLVAYAEMSAALGKAERMERISSADLRMAWGQFQSDWKSITRVGVDEALVRRAAGLARQFGLRAYDSVHLAAAERILFAAGGSDFVFMGFDARLNAAADALGMKLLDGRS